MTLLLGGIVGSTAYGLAREGSDIDRLGVFVADMLDIAGLDWHGSKETKVTVKPDTTSHEVGKFLRLALNCNPTILELLWLPKECYEWRDPDGNWLIEIRSGFLWEKGVRNAYGGYAREQGRKLAESGERFSSKTGNRTRKHARHVLRLLRQGRRLLETGELQVKVDDPEDYWAIDDMSIEEMVAMYAREDELFRATRSVLPAEPNRPLMVDYLRQVRANHVGKP